MARPVDPVRHEARRLQIIDAALTRFAADGYEGATTAAICRTAGIGSGTFFHYFPTKLDVLLATLELGTSETSEWFDAQTDRRDEPVQVLHDYVDHLIEDLTDPRLPGFMLSVGAVMGDPAVAQALEADDLTGRTGLTHWVGRAQELGACRVDLSAEQLVSWLQVLFNGFIDQLATQDSFQVADQAPTLHDLVDRLLA